MTFGFRNRNIMETLRILIEKGQWHEIDSILKKMFVDQTDSAPFTEAIYLLHTTLLNPSTNFPDDGFEKVRQILTKLFEKSSPKFLNDPCYLFFVGYLITLCDWCFGLDDVTLGIDMLRRASELEPSSLLFRWGYSFSTSQADSEFLSREISKDQEVISFLASYGDAGKYIEEQIRNLPYFFSLPKE